MAVSVRMEVDLVEVGTPLDERMKQYERVFHQHLVRRTPVIVRVDGRAFHGVTRNWPSDGPFSQAFMAVMVQSAKDLAAEMQGCLLAYVQSDEASFLLQDWAKVTTESWFGYDLQKVVATSAATMTLAFNRRADSLSQWGTFDARAFNLPREEVANYFLWRSRDWSRNSLQMYARHFFSQKDLHLKGRKEMHEMLHAIGKNWTSDLAPRERNGAWLVNGVEQNETLPRYADIAALVETLVNAAA